MNSKRVEAFGPANAAIIILGEAPGAEELAANKPFVGPAGRMLDKLLESAGIDRDECYITNVVKEQPVDNDISRFIWFNKGKVIPTKEYLEYLEELWHEIEEHPASIVIALGNIALYAALGDSLPLIGNSMAIRRRRGSIYWSSLFNKKVIATVHPSAILRGDFLLKYPVIMDLIRAKEESKFPELRTMDRNIITCPDYAEVLDYLYQIQESAPIEVALDIEVINHEVSCFSFATSAIDAMCIPLVHKGTDYFDPEQETIIWELVAKILENSSLTIVGQNLMFDLAFLRRKFGIVTRAKIEDTMIAHGILAPDLPKNLGFITSTYCNMQYYKDAGKESKWGADSDSDTFYRYNAKDALVCLEAIPKLKKDLEKQGNLAIYTSATKLVPVLVEMQERGMLFDNKAAALDREIVAEELDKIEDELEKEIGFRINVESPLQVADYFYKTLGLKPYLGRKTGRPTVDKIALQRLARKNISGAARIKKARGIRKLINTYYDMTLDDDNRLRGNYNIVGTVTGRLSSSASIFKTGGNMQNLPPRFAKHILADPGYILYNIDLSNAENRIVTYIANESNLIEAFKTGADIHKLTASHIFNKPISSISAEPKSASLGDGSKSERDWGKFANHGLNYGLGPSGFALKCGISDSEGRRIHDIYHNIYPAIKQWHTSTTTELIQYRKLTNLYGRTRLFLAQINDKVKREAYDYIAQSTIADKINIDGLLYIAEHIPLVKLLNQIHDSIVFQIPKYIPWSGHALRIEGIIESLEKPILYKAHKIIIPAEVKLGTSIANLTALSTNTNNLATELERVYTEVSAYGELRREE